MSAVEIPEAAPEFPDFAPAHELQTNTGRRVAILAVVAGLVVLWPNVVSDRNLSSSIAILILGLFAMSLDLLMGYGGLATLGHAMFFAFGGYSAGVIADRITDQVFVTLPVAAIVGGITGFLIAKLALRTRMMQFMIITFAMSGLGIALIDRLHEYTGGTDGLAAIPTAKMGGFAFDSPVKVFYLVAFLVAVSWFLMRRIVGSAFGRLVVGIRDNPVRISSLGVTPNSQLSILFAIGGSFAAVAGALHVYWYKFISPESAGFAFSADGLFMVLVGGASNLYGGLIGAAVIHTGRDRLVEHTDNPNMYLGALFVLFVLFVPGGIVGTSRRIKTNIKARMAARSVES